MVLHWSLWWKFEAKLGYILKSKAILMWNFGEVGVGLQGSLVELTYQSV